VIMIMKLYIAWVKRNHIVWERVTLRIIINEIAVNILWRKG
jgi:hypothetical protein